MSRISMNDIFVATFIVAAYLVFWQVWSGRWARSAWWALPLVGVLIGLAAATKWVGFYALAGLLALVLARSDLGRLLLVALVAFALVVGGIGAPWPFLRRHARAAGGRAGDHLGPSDPARRRREHRRTRGHGARGHAASAWPSPSPTTSVDGREPGSAVEYVFGLLARGAEAEWPVWIMIGVAAALLGVAGVSVAARPALGRPLVPARRDGRLRLVVGRRLPA